MEVIEVRQKCSGNIIRINKTDFDNKEHEYIHAEAEQKFAGVLNDSPVDSEEPVAMHRRKR